MMSSQAQENLALENSSEKPVRAHNDNDTVTAANKAPAHQKLNAGNDNDSDPAVDSTPAPRKLTPQEILKQAQAEEEAKFGPPKGSFLAEEKRRFNKEIDEYSNAAVAHTPAVIPNHASNIIGGLQIVADTAMMKASGGYLWKLQTTNAEGKQVLKSLSWSEPWNAIVFPVKNLWGGAIQRSFEGLKWRDTVKLGTYKKFFGDLKDLDAATFRDRVDEFGNPQKLVNSWSQRSGLMGIMPMTFAAVLPEAQQTPEETLHEYMQRRDHFVTFAATQVGRAIWFIPQTCIQLVAKAIHPEQNQQIGKYKHQFVGFSFVFSGLFSMLSGFRQIQGKIAGNQRYIRNYSQVAVGFFTMVGGGMWTMLGMDAEEGWKNFGKGMIMRNVALPANVISRYQTMEQGAVPYTVAQIIFQVKNVFATLYGGVHKSKSGEIEDAGELLVSQERQRRHQEKIGFDYGSVADRAQNITLLDPKTDHKTRNMLMGSEADYQDQHSPEANPRALHQQVPLTKVHKVAADNTITPPQELAHATGA